MDLTLQFYKVTVVNNETNAVVGGSSENTVRFLNAAMNVKRLKLIDVLF